PSKRRASFRSIGQHPFSDLVTGFICEHVRSDGRALVAGSLSNHRGWFVANVQCTLSPPGHFLGKRLSLVTFLATRFQRGPLTQLQDNVLGRHMTMSVHILLNEFVFA